MSMLLQEHDATTYLKPDAGVVRDARIRQAKRRKRTAAAVAALAVLSALAVWFVGRDGSSAPQGAYSNLLALEHLRQRAELSAPHISPALEGGDYGWCVTYQGTTCGSVPTRTMRAIGGISDGIRVSQQGAVTMTALLPADVQSVLAGSQPLQLVDVHASVPYGLRLVQIKLPAPSKQATTGRGASQQEPSRTTLEPGAPPAPTTIPTLSALAAGETLRLPQPGLERLATRWWQTPQTPAPGPCQIRADGLAGLTPQWGHVVITVQAYPTKLVGRAFFSCADTEYYLQGWPLQTAILLDAEHPGRFPAPIPGMTPVPGVPGTFNAPGETRSEITARRTGNAWLVVAGGSGLAQRIQVLQHLHPTISLPSHDAAG